MRFVFAVTVRGFLTRPSLSLDGSVQQSSTTPAASYSSLPESVLYPSLAGDVTQATASSNDYQGLLPLDVNCILKPNSFDMAKIEEPTGRKLQLLFKWFLFVP